MKDFIVNRFQSITGLLLALCGLLASPGVHAQSISISGSRCVGATHQIEFTSSLDFIRWDVSGPYTILTDSGDGWLEVRWSGAGTFSVAAVYRSSSGVTMAFQEYVTITQPLTPSVSISTPSTSVCPGTAVTFTATPTNGGSTPYYTWRINGTAVSSGSANTFTRSNLQHSDVISVVMSSSSQSCLTTPTATSNSITMNTTPLTPSVSIAASVPSVCKTSNGSVTYTATPVNGGPTTGAQSPLYDWQVNGVTVSSGTSPTFARTNASINEGDVVRVIMTTRYTGCLTTNTAISNNTTTAVTNPRSTAGVSLTASATSICKTSGGSVTYTATPFFGGPSPGYAWQVNGVTVSSGTSSTYTRAISSINYGDVVRVIMTSNEAVLCLTSTTATSNSITMTQQQNVVSVTVSGPTDICSTDQYIAYEAEIFNGGPSPVIQWYKNGVLVEGENELEYYPTGSITSIRCQVTSSMGCISGNATVSSPVLSVTTKQAVTPFIIVDYDKEAICQGESITFSASTFQGISLYNWQWKLNGTPVGASAPSLTTTQFQSGSSVSVTASVSGCVTSNSATGNLSDDISVIPVPNTQLSPLGSLTICSTCSQTLTATPVGNAYRYEWIKEEYESDVVIATTVSPSFAVSETGVYWVKAIQNVCGNVSPDYLSLTVNKKPVANAGPDKTFTLPVGSILLNGTASDEDGTPLTLKWLKVSGPSVQLSGITTTTLTLSNITAGKYVFSLSASDDIETATDYVEVMVYGDDLYNWVETEVLDEHGNLYGNSRSYFDLSGKLLQSQTKQFSHAGTGSVFASQPLRDRYDRVAGTTLSAPIAGSEFRYTNNFIENSEAVPYSSSDFDDPNSNTVLQPRPVNKNTPGTLGWYYSNNNNLEDHVPVTNYPYSRTEFYEDGTGEAKRSASPGDTHRLGMGHEALSGTFPVYNELDDYLIKRRAIGLPDNKSVATFKNEGVQSVVRDVNGKYAVSISDKSGKSVLTARQGSPADHVLSVTSSIHSNLDPLSGDYRPLTYFYLLDEQPVSITAPENTSYVIEDMVTGSTYDPNALGDSDWEPGFYRIVLNAGAISFTYTNYYQDVSCQFYDDAGRLKYSVSPNGYAQWKQGLGFDAIDKTSYNYNHRGWLLSMTEPDAGTSEYIYRKDGSIRFSQNAQQAIDGHFSYTHYDKLGRPVESGEYAGSSVTFSRAGMKDMLELHQQVIWTDTDVKDWFKTHYDFPAPGIPNLPADYQQEFVRGAVSWSENENIATWYSYDEAGRVTWMAQKPHGLDRTFLLKYQYDFLGNVKQVVSMAYANGSVLNKFYHHYEYDADKRLSRTYTSTDGTNKTLRATYIYYLHGPLKRVELGEKVQGIDFVYNINGWLTHINHPDATKDPGGDGAAGDHAAYRNDVFGMLLNYYESEFDNLFQTSYMVPEVPDPNRRLKDGLHSIDDLIKPALFAGVDQSALKPSDYSIDKPLFRELLERYYREQNPTGNGDAHKLVASADREISLHLAMSDNADKRKYEVFLPVENDLAAFGYLTKEKVASNRDNPEITASEYNAANTVALLDPEPEANYKVKPLYNGMITSVAWRTDKAYQSEGEGFAGMYLYDYDDKYQIKEANWATPTYGTLSSTFVMNGNKFRLTGMEYDPNGNILRLHRYNKDAASVNNFTYAYEGTMAENVIPNADMNGLEGFTALNNALLESVTINDETYIRVQSPRTTRSGVQIQNWISVTPGERFTFKVKGYRETSGNALLGIAAISGGVPGTSWLDIQPVSLPYDTENEGSVSIDFTVPEGVSFIAPGVFFPDGVQTGDVFYVNSLSLQKSTGYGNRLASVAGYANAYTYNAIGQMIGADKTAGDDQYVVYDVAGKVRFVYTDVARTKLVVENLYDDRGFRLAKKSYAEENNQNTLKKITWYIRDASGNVVSIYEEDPAANTLMLTEIPVYGSGKIGTCYPQQGNSMVYEITDHLGNVRALVKEQQQEFLATMEDNGVADYSNPRVREMTVFQNLAETAVRDARLNHTPGGEYSAYLNWISGMSNESKSVGPATALKVNKGDVIVPEAWVRYKKEAGNYSRNLTLAALSQFLGTTFAFKAGFEGMNATQVASSFNGALAAASWGSGDPEINAPYAYLNYVLFDTNTGFVDAGWRRVPESAGFDAGQESLPGLHQKVAFEQPIVVPENGYIYVWLSNESENTHVWFDDLKVTREGADVVQATDYGVWGDVIREQKSDEARYRYDYQGQYAEKDDETGWSHFELREYDPVIGRWTAVDPEGQFFSPYVGMGNDPVSGIDPTGGCVDANGNVIPCDGAQDGMDGFHTTILDEVSVTDEAPWYISAYRSFRNTDFVVETDTKITLGIQGKLGLGEFLKLDANVVSGTLFRYRQDFTELGPIEVLDYIGDGQGLELKNGFALELKGDKDLVLAVGWEQAQRLHKKGGFYSSSQFKSEKMESKGFYYQIFKKSGSSQGLLGKTGTSTKVGVLKECKCIEFKVEAAFLLGFETNIRIGVK